MKKFKLKNAFIASTITIAITLVPLASCVASPIIDPRESLPRRDEILLREGEEIQETIYRQLIPNLGSELLSALNIETLINNFNNLVNNIFGTNIINQFFAILNRDFDCADSLRNHGIMIFVPVEPGWCEILPNGNTIGDILFDNRGVLNIPIPSQVQEEIRRAITESDSTSSEGLPRITNTFQTNSLIQANLNSNAAARSQTQIAIESVLGERGQQSIRAQLNSNSSNLAEIANQANVTLNATATQDVMKNIAKQLALDSFISATISSELTKLRIDTQYTNTNLTNLSRSLDQQLRRELVNDSINQSRLLYLNSSASLW